MECHVRDTSIHYETIGEGKPVVLLHGFYLDHRMMMACMEPVFATRLGYRRVYLDLPGMGRSPGVAWIKNSDAMLEAVLAAIESILPGERYLLAGESYGGYIARGILHKTPERVDGALFICPLIGDGRILPPRTAIVKDEALLARLAPGDRNSLAENNTVLTEEMYARYAAEITPAVRLADDAFLQRLVAGGYYYTFDPDAGERFIKPALFLLGRQDSVVGYRNALDIMEHFPRATFAVLDRAAHNLQIEQAGLFAPLVCEWLDRAAEYNTTD